VIGARGQLRPLSLLFVHFCATFEDEDDRAGTPGSGRSSGLNASLEMGRQHDRCKGSLYSG
jgi:hypothetical protein